jgi:predicted nucleic acid-binding protein
MKLVFADTSYFLARINSADSHRTRVLAYSGQTRARLLTTEWVLLELADTLAKTRFRKVIKDYIKYLEVNAEIVWVDERLRQAVLDLYHQHDDKAWSLTDCLSFVVMREFGLTTALTGDRHFIQAGFEAVFV